MLQVMLDPVRGIFGYERRDRRSEILLCFQTFCYQECDIPDRQANRRLHRVIRLAPYRQPWRGDGDFGIGKGREIIAVLGEKLADWDAVPAWHQHQVGRHLLLIGDYRGHGEPRK